MEIRQLKYFLKVAEALNFSEASRRLYITQSTLSQQISHLEQEIGLPLFERNSHGVYLTEAGKHCKLGELIGKAVKAAVKETLYLQTRLGPERQHNVFRRMSRFGVKEADLYHRCRKEMPQQAPSRPIFSEIAENLAKDGTMVARTSFLAHGIDQMDWGLLSVTETLQVSDEILKSMGGKGISGMEELHTPDEAVHCIVDAFEKMMIEQILKEYQKETREE